MKKFFDKGLDFLKNMSIIKDSQGKQKTKTNILGGYKNERILQFGRNQDGTCKKS